MSKKNAPLFEVTLTSPDCDERAWELFALGVGGTESVNDTTLKFYSELPSHELDTLVEKAQELGFTLASKKEIEKENWVAKFEDLLTSFVVNKLTVKPVRDFSEGAALPKSQSQLVLIPGMGFGTGHHPTTRMLLEFMQDTGVITAPPKFALDVGTGSGILAIGLSKLFPTTSIYAFDNDPVAIDNAIENGSLNIPHNVHFCIEELKDIYDQIPDLIIANIYAEVLIHLEPQFKRVLVKGGTALLSGITKEASAGLKEYFTKAGWRIIKEELRGEWYAAAVVI